MTTLRAIAVIPGIILWCIFLGAILDEDTCYSRKRGPFDNFMVGAIMTAKVLFLLGIVFLAAWGLEGAL